MNDFGSAVLVRLVQISLAQAGISSGSRLSRDKAALLPLQTKKSFLQTIAAAHGLVALLRAGSSLQQMATEPTVAALLAARSPQDLFERWRRLERFTHSRHRVVLRQSTGRHIVAEHVCVRGRTESCEDMLILGVLAALLRAIGAQELKAQLGSGPRGPVLIDDDGLRVPAHEASTARWRLSWSAFRPRMIEAPVPRAATAVDRVRTIFREDVGRSWRVAELARALHSSPRSLQRELEPAGGFATLLGQTRALKAAEMLMSTQQPICLIGFACGYADQPHFTREFKRRTAMTPVAYRTAFGVPQRRSPASKSAARSANRRP